MIEYECHHCHTKFMNYRSDKSRYCSRACKVAGTTVNHEHECAHCGKTFYTKKRIGKYCSFACTGLANGLKLKGKPSWNSGRRYEQIRGHRHWNWQGGKPRDLRLTTAYRDWRRAVFAKDDFTCQLCGVRGVKLVADHIKPFAKYPELRLVVSNGRSLCQDCNHRVTYVTKEWRYA